MFVTVDQKLRVRIPKRLAGKLKIRGRERLGIELNEGRLIMTKPKRFDMKSYPLLKDMLEHPLHSKVKITTALLEKAEEEMYK